MPLGMEHYLILFRTLISYIYEKNVGYSMSGTYVKNYCHIVFSTKNRSKCINEDIKQKIYAYMVGVISKQNSFTYAINGMEDHVHILCDLPKNMELSKFVQIIKMNSSRWVNEEFSLLNKFEWQKGYGAFSVSPSKIEQVELYIKNQELHHMKMSFKDEFIEFLNAYNIDFDQQYIWK